ncbi:MAG: aldehyde dehydrogenase family protein [Polyangiales bacterium]
MTTTIDRSPQLSIAGQSRALPMASIRSPYDDRVVGEAPIADAATVEEAIECARRAMETQRRSPTSLHRRVAILERTAAGIAAHAEPLAQLISDEAGKPLAFARVEVARAVDTFEAARDVVRGLAIEGGVVRALSAFAAAGDRLAIERRFAAGAVCAITPFNFPLNLVAHKLAPAIAAGCPVVLKPSPQAPLSSFALAAILYESGLERDLLSVVPCEVALASKLARDDRFAVLTFTGSARVGWRLRGECGDKRCLLELGGNAAAIVCDDADLDRAAARITQGAFGYAGQSCISVQRVIADAGIYDELRARLVAATVRIGSGDPSRDDVVCGPVIDDVAVARIVKTIEDAIAEGARSIAPVQRARRVIAPTILEDVAPTSLARTEEIFAPVVLLDRADDFDAALARANESKYGLQAGIFTRDLDRAMRAWGQLEVGALIHDDVPTFRADAMPYGGVRRSGLGREGPRSLFDELTEPRQLVLRRA